MKNLGVFYCASQWQRVILLLQVIYLTLHYDAVCSDAIEAYANFVWYD